MGEGLQALGFQVTRKVMKSSEVVDQLTRFLQNFILFTSQEFLLLALLLPLNHLLSYSLRKIEVRFGGGFTTLNELVTGSAFFFFFF